MICLALNFDQLMFEKCFSLIFFFYEIRIAPRTRSIAFQVFKYSKKSDAKTKITNTATITITVTAIV